MKHVGYNGAPLTNHPYKFQGVELNESMGLNLYEMELRQYDPSIARFTSIDPITRFSNSTFNAFDNNPVYWSDPSGGSVENGMEDRPTYRGGHWSDEFRGIKPSGDKKETWSQQVFRTTITYFIKNLDEQNGGDLSEEKSDNDVDAYELFYQWIMGSGSSKRDFNENSTMGQQMLKSDEVLKAINRAVSGGKNQTFSRQLKKENPLLYIKSFFEDIDGKNPARGFHGSYSGNVMVDSVTREGNIITTNMTITITDYMTATSGTRASGSKWGYHPKNPVAIYPEQNPYGTNGQFRTIEVNYKIKTSVKRELIKM